MPPTPTVRDRLDGGLPAVTDQRNQAGDDLPEKATERGLEARLQRALDTALDERLGTGSLPQHQ